MTNLLSEVELADATILGFAPEGKGLSVRIKDWQEAELVIVFDEVLGVQALSAEGEEICRGSQVEQDDFLREAGAVTKEDTTGYVCFRFHSAWDDAPRLKVIARSFRVDRPTAASQP